ncbi:protein of unknown function (plasmid) [Cupriavidus taiwanensis]|uniref:Uncharacterized protein n=1 Tax=Cupriavidus taiwanensis TaxID=164546 RepID=A0A9Q7UX40_9BURK|nr:protein of unknown function [Cupriavidus taiwanensis]
MKQDWLRQGASAVTNRFSRGAALTTPLGDMYATGQPWLARCFLQYSTPKLLLATG